MALKTTLALRLSAALSSALDLQSGVSNLDYAKTITLASGTGASQADRVWSDNRTLAASATEDIDLAGSLTDAIGGTFVLARLKMLVIVAAAANTNNLIVGAGTNGIASPFILAANGVNVRPGGLLVLAAPDITAYAVTAGTADILKVANSGAGTSVTYDIIAVGASA